MKKIKYKTKRFIAVLIMLVTIFNTLLGSSAGTKQAFAENTTVTTETQLLVIKLNEMDEENSVKEKEVVVGENYGTLPTPIREGYIFEGWYTEKNDGIKVTEETIVQKDIFELFARWTPIEIQVDFYPDAHPKYRGKISTAYPLNTPPNPAKGGGFNGR